MMFTTRAKFLSIAILASLLIACKSLPPLSPDQRMRMGLPPDEESSQQGRKAAPKPGEPGIVKIERRTAGYTISMVLDASDENVYFEMDLPEGQEATIEGLDEDKKEKGDEKTAEEEKEKLKAVGETDKEEAAKHMVQAQTYFFEKRYDRALLEINRSIERTPNSAVAHSLKGSIHYKIGERDRARVAWEKALDLDPKLDDVRMMLDKMN